MFSLVFLTKNEHHHLKPSQDEKRQRRRKSLIGILGYRKSGCMIFTNVEPFGTFSDNAGDVKSFR